MGVTPKKSLGQNFLRDRAVVARIITAANITAETTVIEVGPGEGVLTEALAATGAQVIAIEIDQDLIPMLQARCAAYPRVQIVHADIRRVYLAELLARYDITTYVVVANLPYYITSSIVRFFMESAVPPTELVLMVQKEVAERILATPGAMSILSTAVAYYGDAFPVCAVSRTSFDPVPKVDSAVIRIVHHGRRTTPEYDKAFFRIVRAGFSARRKMLVGNLANSFHMDKDTVRAILTDCGVAPTARPQELSVDAWRMLAARLDGAAIQTK